MSQRIIRRASVTVAGLLLVGGGLAGATELIHSYSHPMITAGAQMPPMVYAQEPVTADGSASAAEPVPADASAPAQGYAPVAADAPASTLGYAQAPPTGNAAESTKVYVPVLTKVYVQGPGGPRVINKYVCTIQSPNSRSDTGGNAPRLGNIAPKGTDLSNTATTRSATTPAGNVTGGTGNGGNGGNGGNVYGCGIAGPGGPGIGGNVTDPSIQLGTPGGNPGTTGPVNPGVGGNPSGQCSTGGAGGMGIGGSGGNASGKHSTGGAGGAGIGGSGGNASGKCTTGGAGGAGVGGSGGNGSGKYSTGGAGGAGVGGSGGNGSGKYSTAKRSTRNRYG